MRSIILVSMMLIIAGCIQTHPLIIEPINSSSLQIHDPDAGYTITYPDGMSYTESRGAASDSSGSYVLHFYNNYCYYLMIDANKIGDEGLDSLAVDRLNSLKFFGIGGTWSGLNVPPFYVCHSYKMEKIEFNGRPAYDISFLCGQPRGDPESYCGGREIVMSDAGMGYTIAYLWPENDSIKKAFWESIAGSFKIEK